MSAPAAEVPVAVVEVPVEVQAMTPEQAAAEAHAVLVNKVGEMTPEDIKSMGFSDMAHKLGISLKEAHELGRHGLKKLEKEAVVAKAEKVAADQKAEEAHVEHEVNEHKATVVKAELHELNKEYAAKIAKTLKSDFSDSIKEMQIAGLKVEMERRVATIDGATESLKQNLLDGLANGDTKAVREQKKADAAKKEWQDHIGVGSKETSTKTEPKTTESGYKGDNSRGSLTYNEWLQAGGQQGADARAAKGEVGVGTKPSRVKQTRVPTAKPGTNWDAPAAGTASAAPNSNGGAATGAPDASPFAAPNAEDRQFGTYRDADGNLLTSFDSLNQAEIEDLLFEKIEVGDDTDWDKLTSAYIDEVKKNAKASGKEVTQEDVDGVLEELRAALDENKNKTGGATGATGEPGADSTDGADGPGTDPEVIETESSEEPGTSEGTDEEGTETDTRSRRQRRHDKRQAKKDAKQPREKRAKRVKGAVASAAATAVLNMNGNGERKERKGHKLLIAAGVGALVVAELLKHRVTGDYDPTNWTRKVNGTLKHVDLIPKGSGDAKDHVGSAAGTGGNSGAGTEAAAAATGAAAETGVRGGGNVVNGVFADGPFRGYTPEQVENFVNNVNAAQGTGAGAGNVFHASAEALAAAQKGVDKGEFTWTVADMLKHGHAPEVINGSLAKINAYTGSHWELRPVNGVRQIAEMRGGQVHVVTPDEMRSIDQVMVNLNK